MSECSNRTSFTVHSSTAEFYSECVELKIMVYREKKDGEGVERRG